MDKTFIKFAVYSLTSAKLTINLVNYAPHLANITEIHIFDASKNEAIPCSYKLTIQNQNISCISQTKVPIELWTDYIIFKIGAWETRFYCIQTSELQKFNTISFIITVLVFLLVVCFAFILLCGYTSSSMERVKSGIQDYVWRSATSSIDSTVSDVRPPKRVKKYRRTNRSYSKRRLGKHQVLSGVYTIPS